MPQDTLHHQALIETARLELDRAHRAVLAVEAGEIRRGLALGIAALQEASTDGLQTPGEPGHDVLVGVLSTLRQAQSDLDSGALAELANLIEAARKRINL